MGTGLILDGRAVGVPGFDVQNFVDDPRLALAPYDARHRSFQERGWIHLIVVHTTGGIPGGSDHRQQVIRPGFGPSTCAGERVVESWTHDPGRPGGAHVVIDFDGKIYCCADLVTQAAYHAQLANGPSVGIEVVQGHDAELYQSQLDLAARFVRILCGLMPTPIQFQIPAPYEGKPVNRFVVSQQKSTSLADVVGVVGHRDLTSSRGEGDPGGALMDALAAAGAERFNFDCGEDIATWKCRQAVLGLPSPDGIPGPLTVAALRRSGRADGVWRAYS
jgi:hypothetical protein